MVFLARHADGVGGEGWSPMTETLESMSSMPKEAKKTAKPGEVERAAVRELVKAARARGEDLTGPDGLLKSITKQVLESALEEEMTEHLGHDKHQPAIGEGGNVRNGTRPKTVLTDAAGEVTIEVPRDRAGTFAPVIVKKRQRRLTDVDAFAISLYAKGLTTGEISAHFAEVYGVSISKGTISRITDKVVEEMQAWSSRRCRVGTRRSSSTRSMSRPAMGRSATSRSTPRSGRPGRASGRAGAVGRQGRRRVGEVLDERARGPEEPRCGRQVLRRLQRPQGPTGRGSAVFPQAIVQAYVIHLIRATLRYASRKYWDQLARDLRAIYTAPTVEAAWAAFEELEEKWGKPYPGIPKVWQAAWEEFTSFLAYDIEIRRVLFSTNVIESLNARYRRSVGARGHFPTKQAALKCLYLVTRGLDPKGLGQARWITRWKPALNAFAVTFADRMPAAENL
jgi:transposase-like protein